MSDGISKIHNTQNECYLNKVINFKPIVYIAVHQTNIIVQIETLIYTPNTPTIRPIFVNYKAAG